MKLRSEMSAGEMDELYDRIGRRLERVGLETQPKVAARLLELAQTPSAQLRDYAEAIRTDVALTGRLLRLANAAFYAQRSPVTKLDRALVLLGIERTKAVSLGFCLGRASSGAGGAAARELSRHVWGQCIFRATLASTLARSHLPGISGEAFIVGLMLDCTLPLMAKLFGSEFAGLYATAPTPAKLYQLEFEKLEFTHVDVFAVLARRWKLPPVLAKPILWHHTQPPAGRTADPLAVLHKIAYYAGAVQLTPLGVPRQSAPLASVADRLFSIPSAELESVIKTASSEYSEIASVFSDFADPIENLDALIEGVQTQLVELMDEQMTRAIRLETRGSSERLVVCGHSVELEPGRPGEVVAFIASGSGERLISCTVDPQKETPETVARLLGLDEAAPHELSHLMGMMRQMAA